MIFNYSSAYIDHNGASQPEWFMSYACLGNIMGKEFSSFFLNVRSPNVSLEWIKEKMQWASYSGLMEVDNSVITDDKMWGKCAVEKADESTSDCSIFGCAWAGGLCLEVGEACNTPACSEAYKVAHLHCKSEDSVYAIN